VLCKKKAKPLRLLWDCTNLHPQVAWRYIQFMAFPGTAIVLSPLTLETYLEVSLLPTSLIDNLEGAERILASLPQTETSLNEIAARLVDEELPRSMTDFDKLLNTIARKRIQ
jgi:transaldolase/glucose-6-phosphate isomerase